MKFKVFLQIVGGIAVLFTILPFVALDYWWIRVFDFPHLQLTAFTILALLIYFFRFDMRYWGDYTFILIISVCFLVQIVKIFPYTTVANVEVLNANSKDATNFISILSINVLEKSEEYSKVLNEIKEYDPDLVILLETNDRWMNEVSRILSENYPFKVEEPLSNTFGMLLYSKYKLIAPEIKYLVDDEIPSTHSVLLLPSGQEVKLHVIHPTPPMPQHNPKATDRNAEMQMIAEMAKDSKLPVIVAGDFNDVAWSQSTLLFQNVSGLLDPRVGRGMFNSYSANNWLLRWPLDHLFVSKEFRVVDISLGDHVGSDHFPYFAKLSFEPEMTVIQEREKPTEEELEQSEEDIEKANKNDQ
ncbi:endonuclease/exonuclease/phosphatase family protein [Planktosalinus lacus]|uniref:Endonuclease n=1 Tax=Planktosalinus lacus TaxID=1526573 RepID=A0A8J2Y679_9FLAO|nr:endonuclease/exonuclease/phosphatase family protein [Planktosalinus lacus]GGD90027.1 endonuclease [Planktosalinus lacus]